MQAQMAIAKERSPIKVEIISEGRTIYSKTFYPRGLRKDASLFVYEEIFLKPEGKRLRLRLEETAHKDKVKEIEFDIPQKPKESVLITYDDATGSFVVLR